MSQNNNTGATGAENSITDELSPSSSSSSVRRIWLPCFYCYNLNAYVQYHNVIYFQSLPCWCDHCLRYNPHWGYYITLFANYGWNTEGENYLDLQISLPYHNAADDEGRTGEEEEEIDNNDGNSDDFEYANDFETIEEAEVNNRNDYREETIQHYLITRDCKKCGNNEKEEEEEICVICQTEFEEDEIFKRLDCGHDYHSICISQWLLLKNSCPLCISTVIPSDFESNFNSYFYD